MSLDYSTLALKCGLEVHQQLQTGKLFCRCPSVLREDAPQLKIKRYLRPVVSEMGEYDKAALEAYQKGLYYLYEAYPDTTCAIECDESPPKEADPEAVKVLCTIALLTKCSLLQNVPVMRKLVIDGSNTSGFQRTALMAINGTLQIPSGKKIGIQSLALEEDAARQIEKDEYHITYRLDRLGIPLIELATEPDITTPAEAKETALAIGTLFRRTCKAMRGLGSIRQDLNVSIKDGARIEIKGVQELELIDEYVRREMQRQQRLLELKEELHRRKIDMETIRHPLSEDTVNLVADCSSIFSTTNCKFLKGKTVFGTRFLGFKGLFGFEVQPNRRFGTELANYVKTKVGLSGILHSDELPGYGISAEEVKRVEKNLQCEPNDAFILVTAELDKASHAFDVILDRCEHAFRGVPEETRQAIEGGNTEYLRPLPGAARMYPETDLPRIEIEEKTINELKKKLPLTPEERVALYTKHSLSKQMAEHMKLDNFACFFEEQLEQKQNASFIAWVLLEGLTQLKRQNVPIENLTEKHLSEFFQAHAQGKIIKENALSLLQKWAEKPQQSLAPLLQTGSTTVSAPEVEQIVEKIVQNNVKLVQEKKMDAIGPLMGDVMKQLRGKVSGEKAADLLKKAIQKELSP